MVTKTFSPDLFRKKALKKGLSHEETDQRLAYALNISTKGYPVIFNREHLAKMIGIEKSRLSHIIINPEKHYKYFRIQRKRKGPPREIMAPVIELKYIQKWISINILEKLPQHPACMSYRKKISIKDHALIHERKKYLLKVDIAKFFDSIEIKRIVGVFKSMGYSTSLSIDLAMLCTARHRESYWDNLSEVEKKLLSNVIDFKSPILPHGSPASPLLSNFILSNMDNRFEKMAQSNGFNYSRYADDLAFSSDNKTSLPNENFIKKIMAEEGFVLNEEKTRFLPKGSKQILTGLTITHGTKVPKNKRKLINTHLHYCNKYGVKKHLSIRRKKNKPFTDNSAYQDWLYGNIQWIKSIQPEVGLKMMQEYHKINWNL